MRVTILLVGLLSVQAAANPDGRVGHSGKQSVTCTSCHASTGAPITASITGPAAVAAGGRYTFQLSLTGRTTGYAGANIASSDGALVVARGDLKLLGGELTHPSRKPVSADGGTAWFFNWTPPATSGPVTLYAATRWAGEGGSASGSQTAVTTFVVTVSQPPTVATAASATPATVAANTTSLRVLGADDNGESNLTYTWSMATGPAGAPAPTFSVNGTNAAKMTTATFSRVGVYTLRATIADAISRVTSDVIVTVTPTFSSVVVTPANTTLAFGGRQIFTASGKDQFGQPLPVAPAFVWAGPADAGVLTPAGSLTASSSAGGPYAISATSGSLVGIARVTIAAGTPPTVAQAAAAALDPLGKTVALSVLGADDTGEAGLVYTWTASGPAGAAPVTFSANGTNAAKRSIATLPQAGAYTLTATIRDRANFAVNSTVLQQVPATLTSLVISPASVTLAPRATRQFSVAQRDQFARAMGAALQPVWASLGSGSISGQGLYAAGSDLGGPFAVRVTVGSLVANAEVRVSNGGAPVIQRAPTATPALVMGRTTQLRVMADDVGPESELRYTWSADGPADVEFSVNETNAAKVTTATFSAPGQYTFTVVARNSAGLSTASSVDVEVQQVVERIVVTPAQAILKRGATQDFAASGADQFDQPVTTGSFVWASRGGEIDDNGQLVAGALDGIFNVTARRDGQFGEAHVRIDSRGPEMALRSPADRTVVSGSILLQATATDDDEVAAVDFLVNGLAVARAESAPFQAMVDTRLLPIGDGVIQLEAEAIDRAGNRTRSAAVSIGIWNDRTKPAPTFGPASGCGVADLSPAVWLLILLWAWAVTRRETSKGRV